MKLVGKKELYDFSRRHADARGQITAWVAEVEEAEWETPQDISGRYPHASFLDGNRVVFNLKGNDYRLVVKIAYRTKVVKVIKVGTHAEYDRWTL